jgi:hypothetical protein
MPGAPSLPLPLSWPSPGPHPYHGALLCMAPAARALLASRRFQAGAKMWVVLVTAMMATLATLYTNPGLSGHLTPVVGAGSLFGGRGGAPDVCGATAGHLVTGATRRLALPWQ